MLIRNNIPWAWISSRITAIGLIVLLPTIIFSIFFQETFVLTSPGSTFMIWGILDLFIILKFGVLFDSSTVLIIGAIFQIIFFLHIFEGIRNIIYDYVHSPSTEAFLVFFVGFVQIVAFKHFFIFLFL